MSLGYTYQKWKSTWSGSLRSYITSLMITFNCDILTRFMNLTIEASMMYCLSFSTFEVTSSTYSFYIIVMIMSYCLPLLQLVDSQHLLTVLEGCIDGKSIQKLDSLSFTTLQQQCLLLLHRTKCYQWSHYLFLFYMYVLAYDNLFQ